MISLILCLALLTVPSLAVRANALEPQTDQAIKHSLRSSIVEAATPIRRWFNFKSPAVVYVRE
jgi:hypothetical protein